MAATALFVLSSLVMASTVQAQDCSQPDGGPLISLREEDIVKDTFPDQQRIRLRCNVGYAPAGGSPFISCRAGSWTPVTLRCEKKNCGSAGEVPNARITYEGTEFGDKAVIRCNKGYQMIGQSEIICGDQGWIGRLPVCEGMKCVSPPGIQNGDFRPEREAYDYRDVVTYSCNSGYTLEGGKEMMCSENGEFIPTPPSCKPDDCSKPGGGSNMHLKGADLGRYTFPHGSTVTFECNIGFNGIGGSPLSTCTAGRWSPVALKCEIKDCGRLKDVVNGRINSEGTVYGDKAEISCVHGYRLEGNSTITCKEDGWTSEPPICQKVKCASPPVVANGSFTPVKAEYILKEAVSYSCDHGYELIGKKRLTCSINDVFTPGPPICNPKDCSKPGVEPNMHLKGDNISKYKFAHGSVVTFECDVGFKPAGGSPQITCTAGSWSQVELKCEIKNCGPLEDVVNGRINSEGTEYGDKAEISCVHGYRLEGNSTITCGEDGWTSEPPICQKVKCDLPPVVANGRFIPVKAEYGFEDVVVYSCDDDYDLRGANNLTCSENDVFTPDPPKCEKVECVDPDIPNADLVDGSQRPYGHMATVTYRCKDGYKIKGSDSLTCDINSQWSPGIPQCIKAQDCFKPELGPILSLSDDDINKETFPDGYTARLKCATGYRLATGSRIITCTAGSWSLVQLTCEKKSCGSAGTVTNGDIKYDGIEYGDKATVVCRKGYRLIGNAELTCGDQGWLGKLPTCEA